MAFLAFVKLKSARQSLNHGRERRSMGTAYPLFACSPTGRPAAHHRYSCCDQRDFLSAAHRLYSLAPECLFIEFRKSFFHLTGIHKATKKVVATKKALKKTAVKEAVKRVAKKK